MKQIGLFNIKKEQLQESISNSLVIFKDLNMTNEVEETRELKEKLEKDSFKVVVMGQFKVGKSTFINSLLGDEILPAYVTPCTAIINEVKYSEEKKAIIHFKNPVPNPYPAGLEKSIKAHIDKHNGTNVPPVEVPVSDMEKYVVINDYSIEQKEAVAQVPYEKAELFWDLPICKQGVEVIDSPGLNENISRTVVTMSYLTKADAIVFVLNCQAICAENEMQVINKDILESGHEYIFFVCNRINQIQLKERDRLKAFAYNKLKSKTKFGEKGIFFINAEAAKEGKINKNEQQVIESGVREVETLLEDFLANNRGKIKLKQPALKIERAIDKALKEIIPNEVRLLALSNKQLEERLQKELPNLERLQREKDQLKERLNNRINRIKGEISVKIADRFEEIIRQIPDWSNEIEADSSISILHPKDSVKTFSEEIVHKLQTRIAEEQQEWQKSIVTPFIDGRLQELATDFETKIKQILLDVEQIKLRISGEENLEVPGTEERIAATVAGFLGGGFSGAALGTALGFSSEFVGTIVAQIVTATTLLLLGVSNPVTIVALILIAVFGGLIGKVNMEQQVKDKIAAEIILNLRNEKDKNVQKIINEIHHKMVNRTNKIDNNLNNELNSVAKQVDKIRKEKEKGERQVAERIKKLEEHTQTLILQKANIQSIIASLSLGE
ncbi:MAG: dynamin family protein [Candidatus Azobacteroides sp.]|nr:dynamin family protein [Candidatus Azobacteroides sp.]